MLYYLFITIAILLSFIIIIFINQLIVNFFFVFLSRIIIYNTNHKDVFKKLKSISLTLMILLMFLCLDNRFLQYDFSKAFKVQAKELLIPLQQYNINLYLLFDPFLKMQHIFRFLQFELKHCLFNLLKQVHNFHQFLLRE